MLKLTASAVSQFKFNGQIFYVKRDDLLSSEFNGNKARKLNSFIQQPPAGIKTLVSYGGYQSNLMYALSCLAKLNNWQFNYYSRKVATSAALGTEGNLAASLKNGMQLVEVADAYQLTIQTLLAEKKPQQLLIQQGGAQKEAEFGLAQLANEIKLWATAMKFSDLAVFVASGTGTTALYLQKHLTPFTVYTTNCVGSKAYLLQQFQQLLEQPQQLPQIFENSRFRFATPNPELLTTIKAINATSQIEFDMVYDPVGWQILLANSHKIRAPILYLHCGGTLGNSSMLKRYLFK